MADKTLAYCENGAHHPNQNLTYMRYGVASGLRGGATGAGVSRDWGDRGGSGMIARIAAGWGIENWGGFCTGRRLRAGFHLTPIIEVAE